MTNRYVAGLLFNANLCSVVLLFKDHPEWQAGKCNAVGGHINDGETEKEAMAREFNEEVFLVVNLNKHLTTSKEWTKFCVLRGNDIHYTKESREFEVHFFWAVLPFQAVSAKTPEVPKIIELESLPNCTVPNLRWLIPMALNQIEGSEHTTEFEVKETYKDK